MEKYERPKSSLASHRRRFEPLDMNKSSSSLNVSTSSSLRSIGEKTRKDEAAVQTGRRTTAVRFAPPSKSSLLAESTKTTSSLVSGQQAMARPATASGPRPGSSAGPRTRASAARLSEAGPKAMRRSWGLTGAMDAKEERRNDPSAPKTQQARSSSVPRRILPPEEKEKPLPKRGSKIMTTSRTKTSESLLQPDNAGSRSPPEVARKTSGQIQKAPNIVSLNNTIKVSPASRVTVTMIGESWGSLPSDVQALGLEVMTYRDNAQAAAVELLQEASAAEVLLRCLSAFAELTSTAAEQPPPQTVDEFLALHAALTTSSTAGDDKQGRPAGEWLRAAVATDLAPFSLYSATRSGRTAPVSSQSPALERRPAATGEEEAGAKEDWMDAARRGLGEEMREWFFGHVERLLDGDVAGTLGQLKRVSDWLDAVGLSSESSSEAVERVRKKIYGFLLDHVESAVVALNGGGAAPGRRK